MTSKKILLGARVQPFPSTTETLKTSKRSFSVPYANVSNHDGKP